MASIQVDEQTAQEIERKAKLAGLSAAEFLRHLLADKPVKARRSWDEIERGMDELTTGGGSLPSDFSRADIYDPGT